jgi:uncharacterized protein YqhQ
MATAIGGQAVIEGVMIRGKKVAYTAVRKGKQIVYRKDLVKKRPKWFTWFFIRGIVNLVDMLVLGIKTLNWSAAQSEDEEDQLSEGAVIGTLFISFAFSIGLFLLLPYALTYLLGLREQSAPVLFNIVDGIIKIGIFVLYVYLISRMEDIKTLFRYHGAEHKAIHCYEAKKVLVAKEAQQFSRLHPRCGTSFMLFVMVVAIFLFSFIPSLVQSLFPGIIFLHWFWQRLVLFGFRILLLPVVAGFSYELLRYSAYHQDNVLFRMLARPGMWIQKITTAEPTLKQLTVSLAAVKKVLDAEKIRYSV